MKIRFALIPMILLLLTLGMFPLHAQDQVNELLSVRVNAGFAGFVRPNMWFPLHVTVNNQGNNLTGRLLVRPETSGDAIYNTYSTPIDISSGSTQEITLYVTARVNVRDLRVELMTDTDEIVATADSNVRVLESHERLYLIVSDAATGALDLSPAAPAGYNAQQIVWDVDRIPNRPGVLDSIDVILFSDVDTGQLSPSQQSALTNWVARGGHLIVTGGANWQPTASGVTDLLPYTPNTSSTTEGLAELAVLAGRVRNELSGEMIYAEGELGEGVQILAASEDGAPLVVRHELGNGTVDYLTFDLTGQPIRGWLGLRGLWLTLLSSTQPRPGWTDGFFNFPSAITAVQIMPGISLLPAIMSLLIFLGAYIVLIGPVNYLVLSRLNRRELAWFSIPVLILVFSVIAWNFGAELRGNTVRMSRLSVVQSWPDAEEARLDQLMGLLAPRRGDYSFSIEDDRLLRPIAEDLGDFTLLSTNSALDVRQGTRFEAADFPVDASFIQAFELDGVIPKPDIGGRLAMAWSNEIITDPSTGITRTETLIRLQGTVFNNTELTLTDPVILGRGLAYQIGQDLEPGALMTLNADDLLLSGDYTASPSPLELAVSDTAPSFGGTSISLNRTTSRAYSSLESQSIQNIIGEDAWQDVVFGISFDDDEETQEKRRRQALLTAFMADQYASTGRGDRVYLAAWADQAPTQEQINGDEFIESDSTLYLVELTVEPISDSQARITTDRFTWFTLERDASMGNVGPNNFYLGQESEFAVRFTPVPTARLSEVEELTISLEFRSSALADTEIELWNWDRRRWEGFLVETEDSRAFVRLRDEAAPFIGPMNAVQVRVLPTIFGSQILIERLNVEQSGRF